MLIDLLLCQIFIQRQNTESPVCFSWREWGVIHGGQPILQTHFTLFNIIVRIWSVLVNLLNHNADRFRLTQIKVCFKPFSDAKLSVVFAPRLLRENFLPLMTVLFICHLWEASNRCIWGIVLFVRSRLLTFFEVCSRLSYQNYQNLSCWTLGQLLGLWSTNVAWMCSY